MPSVAAKSSSRKEKGKEIRAEQKLVRWQLKIENAIIDLLSHTRDIFTSRASKKLSCNTNRMIYWNSDHHSASDRGWSCCVQAANTIWITFSLPIFCVCSERRTVRTTAVFWDTFHSVRFLLWHISIRINLTFCLACERRWRFYAEFMVQLSQHDELHSVTHGVCSVPKSRALRRLSTSMFRCQTTLFRCMGTIYLRAREKMFCLVTIQLHNKYGENCVHTLTISLLQAFIIAYMQSMQSLLQQRREQKHQRWRTTMYMICKQTRSIPKGKWASH